MSSNNNFKIISRALTSGQGKSTLTVHCTHPQVPNGVRNRQRERSWVVTRRPRSPVSGQLRYLVLLTYITLDALGGKGRV